MKFKIGDKVKVLDPGLAMLRNLMPKGTRPNHHGVVSKILGDVYIVVRFPIGDDDPEEHSQDVPYPPDMVIHR